MPVTPTFPGVYIEEIPSGVHTITGVATSIAAFIDYFTMGPMNEAVQILSFGDFERQFGGLNSLSEASYAIQQFFLNGGSEAWVVRVASSGPAPAGVNIADSAGGGGVLTVTAIDEGTWGDNLRVRVDSAGTTGLFNLTVSLYQTQGSRSVVVEQEVFRNLSMISTDPTFVETVVNDANTGSVMVRVVVIGPNPPMPNGTLSSPLADPVTVAGPISGTVAIGSSGAKTITPNLTAGSNPLSVVASALEEAIRGAVATNPEFSGATVDVVVDGAGNHLRMLAGSGGPSDLITFDSGAMSTSLGLNPLIPAVVSAPLADPVTVAGPISGTVTIGSSGAQTITPTITAGSQPLSVVASALQDAIRAAAANNPEFSEATVGVVVDGTGNHLKVLAGPGGPSDSITFDSGAMSTSLRLDPAEAEPPPLPPSTAASNVQEYTLGDAAAIDSSAQLAGVEGNDGLPPNGVDLIGVQATKTGIFALEDVDLFNLLCIPRTAMTASTDPNPLTAAEAFNVIAVAEQYCESRRAFFLMDSPSGVTTPTGIKNYLAANDSLRDKNAGLYYPRVKVPDPLNGFRLRSFGASGTVAGLCARIDSARGVWKAPAGTEANLVNVPQLDYSLTDGENGVLNPLAINCLRNFPVFGNVCWGSRTLEGADQIQSDWKYVPVRRFTLFLEESLYRGSKWVVFEPNDEPLWAQIRLNFGAFMQSLFRQGAFQGKSSREAYFVKCDSETTTQTDINNGIVNIVVGFAPLKPAEFVIIQIQQIAGQIPT